MSRVLVNESGTLEFTFDARWEVYEWDREKAYRQGIGELHQTKAMDFLGIYQKEQVVLIEIKDCRVDPTSNKERLGFPLAVEVAQKARDTIAGVIGAGRRRLDGDRWVRLGEVMRNSDRRVDVIVWLEVVPTQPQAGPRIRWEKTAPVSNQTVARLMKTQLRWLSCRTAVQHLGDYQYLQALGVSARNLAGAGFASPERKGRNTT